MRRATADLAGKPSLALHRARGDRTVGEVGTGVGPGTCARCSLRMDPTGGLAVLPEAAHGPGVVEEAFSLVTLVSTVVNLLGDAVSAVVLAAVDRRRRSVDRARRRGRGGGTRPLVPALGGPAAGGGAASR